MKRFTTSSEISFPCSVVHVLNSQGVFLFCRCPEVLRSGSSQSENVNF